MGIIFSQNELQCVDGDEGNSEAQLLQTFTVGFSLVDKHSPKEEEDDVMMKRRSCSSWYLKFDSSCILKCCLSCRNFPPPENLNIHSSVSHDVTVSAGLHLFTGLPVCRPLLVWRGHDQIQILTCHSRRSPVTD